MVTAYQVQSRQSVSDRGSAGCPRTAQHQPSCQMSKHPLRARTDASKDSDVHSERVLDAARMSACGNGFSVTESAERARSWISRLFEYLMTPSCASDA